jgi:mono/diheme cytochrome c family protein
MTTMRKMLITTGCAVLLAAALPMSNLLAQKKGGDAGKGKTAFDDNCAVCHNTDSDEKKIGPGLKGLFKKDKMNNGKKPTEANVRALLNTGGNGMPPFADMLSDTERDDVIAYLKTL